MTNETLQANYQQLGYTLEFKVCERNGKPAAKCTKPSKGFSGVKCVFNYYFSSEQSRTDYVQKFYDVVIKQIQIKQEAKAIKKAYNANVKAAEHFKVGDIVVNTWGYEQTNVEFYQVTAVTGKSIKVREVSQKIEDNSMYSHGMACNVLPKNDNFIGDEFMLRLKADHNNEVRICNPKSYYYFCKWSGTAQYNSWYN